VDHVRLGRRHPGRVVGEVDAGVDEGTEQRDDSALLRTLRTGGLGTRDAA
jgi:hypothetical protein